ncbi:MAG: hypothetical protein R6U20_01860 [Longimonas sp.]|uniref:hypothetical protein n=1 Tax=Longimonas sp. TaxID=2039626 RepID=UPI003976ECAF
MTLSYRRRKPGIYLRISHKGTRRYIARYIALGTKGKAYQWSKAEPHVASTQHEHESVLEKLDFVHDASKLPF